MNTQNAARASSSESPWTSGVMPNTGTVLGPETAMMSVTVTRPFLIQMAAFHLLDAMFAVYAWMA